MLLSIPDEFGAVGSKGLTVYQLHYICFDDHNSRLVPNISFNDHNSFLDPYREGVILPLKRQNIPAKCIIYMKFLHNGGHLDYDEK